MVQMKKENIILFHEQEHQMKRRYFHKCFVLLLLLLLLFFPIQRYLNASNEININSSGISSTTVQYYNNPNIVRWQQQRLQQEKSGGGGGLCPELLAAARWTQFAPDSFLPDKNNLRFRMIQLVGRWDDNNNNNDNKTADIMHRVFQHNKRIVEQQGIQATAITEPPQNARWLSPPYWKMKAVLENCGRDGDGVDVLWFLDGDVILLEKTVRVEMIWYYHRYWARHDNADHHQNDLDLLFSADHNDHNSGIVLVNCKSPTALQFIKQWHDVAMESMQWPETRQLGWYEQTALHYLLDTPFWQQHSTRRRYPQHQNYFLKQNTTESTSESTSASVQLLRDLHRRIRTTSQSCSLFSQNVDFFCNAEQLDIQSRGPMWYEPGQFAVHTAGIRRSSIRIQYFQNALRDYERQEEEEERRRQEQENETRISSSSSSSSSRKTLQEAAKYYLQHHEGRRSIDPLLERNFDAEKCMHEI